MQDVINEQQCEEDDEEIEENTVSEIPNVTEALKAADLLSHFVHSSLDSDSIKSSMSKVYNAIRNHFYSHKVQRQTKMSAFL